MPRYEVTKTSYLNQPDPRSDTGVAPRIVRADTRITYDGWPGASLKPLDAEARRRVAIVEENRKFNEEAWRRAANVEEYRKIEKRLPATVEEHDEEVKAAKAEARRKAKTPDDNQAVA